MLNCVRASNVKSKEQTENALDLKLLCIEKLVKPNPFTAKKKKKRLQMHAQSKYIKKENYMADVHMRHYIYR